MLVYKRFVGITNSALPETEPCMHIDDFVRITNHLEAKLSRIFGMEFRYGSLNLRNIKFIEYGISRNGIPG